MMKSIISVFTIKASETHFNRTRIQAIATLMPLMYCIVGICMVSVAFTHFHVAPKWLTIIPTSLYVLETIHRVYRYFHPQDISTFSDEKIYKLLCVITVFAPLTTGLMVVWEFTLFQYGDARLHSHLFFFAGVTAIASSFCFMHVRPAALLMVLVSTPTTVGFLLLQGDPILNAVAVNMAFVGVFMTILLNLVHRDLEVMNQHRDAVIGQSRRLEQMHENTLRLANTDPLTSLPNRRAFFSHIDDLASDYEETGKPFVVGLLDLDGFKPVNDVFGHPAGDQLLIDTSNRLVKALGENAVVARLGGDEFGIVIPTDADDDAILDLGEHICDVIRQPFQMKEGAANIAATVGFARYPDNARDSHTLFDRADYALCYAKQNEKGVPVFFSDEHEALIREVSIIEQRLREANLKEEMSVVFQPIIDSTTGAPLGFEALARWANPHLGDVPPDSFIRSAEQGGTITHLTEVLLQKALHEMRNWPIDVYMTFNLSSAILSSPASVRRLISLVRDAEIDMNRIVFEVTETMVMQDYDRVVESLHNIRNEGACLALDDFGTGFSSLSYVQKLPIDILKVDRSFVANLEDDAADRNIVRTISDLCRNLNLDCIVEGVETKGQLDIICDMGLKKIQGYYFSYPMQPEDALSFIREHVQNDKLSA